MPDATGFDGSTFLEVKGEITTGYNAGPFEPTINGVRITQKPQITDERGSVMHMLRADAPEFMEFGEIYFSTVNPGFLKGWHLHRRMFLNYVCVHGEITLHLYDGRLDSSTNGVQLSIELSPRKYFMVTVPPGVWNGFECVGGITAIVANCATEAHDPSEIVREDPWKSLLPHPWKAKKGF